MNIVNVIIAAAKAASVPPALLLSICSAESDLRSRMNVQDGGSASYGVCQVKLSTAQMFDKMAGPSLLMTPAYNAKIAAQYLKMHLDKYPNNRECVIAAYNAGTCRFNKHGKIMNRKYVARVKQRLEKYETPHTSIATR